MTEKELLVWEKIRDFELDDTESSFTFTDRLARENSWSMQYATRAVFEYKKFIFLICIDPGPKTPSDEIDQVWHLHLLYTYSYWQEMCKNLLNKDIHHGPTKGAEQRDDFKNYYAETKRLYEKYFNAAPPIDIWPNEQERFSQIHFSRVNRHTNWVIPKLKLRKK